MAIYRDNEECQELIDGIRSLGEESIILVLSSMVHELASPSSRDLRKEAALLMTIIVSVVPEVYGMDMEELFERYEEEMDIFINKDDCEVKDNCEYLVEHYLEDKSK